MAGSEVEFLHTFYESLSSTADYELKLPRVSQFALDNLCLEQKSISRLNIEISKSILF